MHLPAPYLADRAAVEDAHALITLHGEEAGFAAAARAEQYRALGNHVHFARWRQIERLITYLSRSEEHTSELQSLMRISYAVFCLKKKKNTKNIDTYTERYT